MPGIPNIGTLFGALFGNTADQATVGRATSQVLLILLGTGLVITGIVFVVAGSKTAQVVTTVASKGAALVTEG